MDTTVLVLAIIFGIACFILAKVRKRNPWLWLLLGFVFNFVPLLVLLVLPDGDLEDELYQLKTKVRLLEAAQTRDNSPVVKIQKVRAAHGSPSPSTTQSE